MGDVVARSVWDASAIVGIQLHWKTHHMNGITIPKRHSIRHTVEQQTCPLCVSWASYQPREYLAFLHAKREDWRGPRLGRKPFASFIIGSSSWNAPNCASRRRLSIVYIYWKPIEFILLSTLKCTLTDWNSRRWRLFVCLWIWCTFQIWKCISNWKIYSPNNQAHSAPEKNLG